MVVIPLFVKKNPFCPYENGEKILGPEVPYLNAIDALMYLANCIRPYCIFCQFISQV